MLPLFYFIHYTCTSWKMQDYAFFFALKVILQGKIHKWFSKGMQYLCSQELQLGDTLAVYVLSRTVRSSASETLEVKWLGHFSKAVIEPSFPLEYFKSDMFVWELMPCLHWHPHGNIDTQWSTPSFPFILHLMKKLCQRRIKYEVC